jgi:uncharacterized damage-inducible protein DinB
VSDLERLFAYNRWANVRMLGAADELSAEELSRAIKSSFPSVLATLVHMLGSEWVWLERWRGASPESFPDAADLGTVAAVRERWDALWADQRAFLGQAGDDGWSRTVRYRLFSGKEDQQPLGDLARHMVNHATYHRGQVVMMLRQLDKTPPSTDYVRFLREEVRT